MREPFNTTFTIFEKLKEKDVNKNPPIDITLGDIYARIKKGNPTLIDKINTIRTTTDSKLKTATKESLKCIQFNGTFKERNGAGFIEHSGICILDFDKYPDLKTQTEERERLKTDRDARPRAADVCSIKTEGATPQISSVPRPPASPPRAYIAS